jgi:DNA-binding CsgD family transcriptional regulator
MTLHNIEFSGLPEGEVEIRMEGKVFKLEPNHRDFIVAFIQLLISKRLVALNALEKRYAKSKANTIYYEFLIVRGFIKCNFIQLDNHLDIDAAGNLNTEYVLCPRTGECHECGLICNSPANSELSDREKDVLRLIVAGCNNTEIADQLYISQNTVHNHRNNILKKLGMTNTAELVRYWFENEMQ